MLKSQDFSKILPKLVAKFLATFRLLPELFPCPQKISWEISYTILSDIFIFVNILKLEFLPKFWILWENLGKIQSLWPKISQNFPWNIDKIVGATTLIIAPDSYLSIREHKCQSNDGETYAYKL